MTLCFLAVVSCGHTAPAELQLQDRTIHGHRSSNLANERICVLRTCSGVRTVEVSMADKHILPAAGDSGNVLSAVDSTGTLAAGGRVGVLPMWSDNHHLELVRHPRLKVLRFVRQLDSVVITMKADSLTP